MSLRDPTRLGIIETCLSSPAKAPPSGPGWIHEIKRFRILARRKSFLASLSFPRNGRQIVAGPVMLDRGGSNRRRGSVAKKRKASLAKLPKEPHLNIVLNEHFEEDGAIVFREACKLGCEGIVSKRLGSSYRSGRSRHWIKVNNPAAPAVKREEEEDWVK